MTSQTPHRTPDQASLCSSVEQSAEARLYHTFVYTWSAFTTRSRAACGRCSSGLWLQAVIRSTP